MPSQDILRQGSNWRRFFCYEKADTLYQLTFVFCQRFLPQHGDRTVDQMLQAARSGKQNIIEGSEDGKTSTEMELRLLNVARSSLQELREDYADFLHTRKLPQWDKHHPRYSALLEFCRTHNTFEHYAHLAERCTAEEFCNTALTLCHMTDRMLWSYLKRLEQAFVEQGGIKERMHAARTNYRKAQDQLLITLKAENEALKSENASLKAQIAALLREREDKRRG